MGNKYEVYAWKQVGHNPDRYSEVEVYRGESLIRAAIAMARAKRQAGYVKLEWRD